MVTAIKLLCYAVERIWWEETENKERVEQYVLHCTVLSTLIQYVLSTLTQYVLHVSPELVGSYHCVTITVWSSTVGRGGNLLHIIMAPCLLFSSSHFNHLSSNTIDYTFHFSCLTNFLPSLFSFFLLAFLSDLPSTVQQSAQLVYFLQLIRLYKITNAVWLRPFITRAE